MNYLTAAQFAAKSGVNPRRVRVWIAEGRVPAEKIGRDWMIPEETTRPNDARFVESPVRNRRK